MTVSRYLNDATAYLDSCLIPSARLDVLILMELVLSIDRAKLLSEPGMEITSKHKKLLDQYVAKRAKHLPISYITNRAEFYGRNFYINSSVMQPRPESEDIIDLLKKLVVERKDLKSLEKIKIVDIGTGSGCLGITAALEVRNAIVELVDIDENALNVAKRNVVLHTISISTIVADLFPVNLQRYDILLCNLPYLPDGFKINQAAKHEPGVALFGGEDGLDIYRKLFKKIKKSQNKPLYILSESLPESHDSLQQIAIDNSYQLMDSIGYVQLFSLS